MVIHLGLLGRIGGLLLRFGPLVDVSHFECLRESNGASMIRSFTLLIQISGDVELYRVEVPSQRTWGGNWHPCLGQSRIPSRLAVLPLLAAVFRPTMGVNLGE